MKPTVIVWDLETVPDLGGFAAANDLVGKSDVEVREAIGLEFLVRHDRQRMPITQLSPVLARIRHTCHLTGWRLRLYSQSAPFRQRKLNSFAISLTFHLDHFSRAAGR